MAPADAFGPRVPIELRAAGRSVQLWAPVDTGSDGTYMPATCLERLGLTDPAAGTDEADFPLIQQRPVRVEYREVVLSVGGRWSARMVGGFAYWDVTHPEPLLGREVTRKFRTTLDGPNRLTIIEAPGLAQPGAAAAAREVRR